ncbi:2998_t:CDS:1, partial [Entrophospora sp. SA101]
MEINLLIEKFAIEKIKAEFNNLFLENRDFPKLENLEHMRIKLGYQ